jgi:curved DNA-binding protein CbpA
MFDEHTTHYDVLNISPSASPQEVRDAYIRCKNTYQRDSVVLYSLIESAERESILKKIEEAYAVLSNLDKRREYDNHTGIIAAQDNPFPHYEEESQPDKVVSIDRSPPMETFSDGDAILIPPSTDFEPSADRSAPITSGTEYGVISRTEKKEAVFEKSPQPATFSPEPSERGSTEDFSHPKAYARVTKSGLNTTARGTPLQPEAWKKASLLGQSQLPSQFPSQLEDTQSETPVSQPPPALAALAHQIGMETEWSGAFLRKVRTMAQVSIEEMSDITKVTKTYLNAIEEENFDRLPAGVYVRGFVIQIAKVLRLPPEKVASAYLSRYYAKRHDR